MAWDIALAALMAARPVLCGVLVLAPQGLDRREVNRHAQCRVARSLLQPSGSDRPDAFASLSCASFACWLPLATGGITVPCRWSYPYENDGIRTSCVQVLQVHPPGAAAHDAARYCFGCRLGTGRRQAHAAYLLVRPGRARWVLPGVGRRYLRKARSGRDREDGRPAGQRHAIAGGA